MHSSAMAYRVNGLPPFQVSFSITFPEGYVGKNKLDTRFQLDAEGAKSQVGVLEHLAKTAEKFETARSHPVTEECVPLHTKLEALRVIASTGRPCDEKPFMHKQQSRDLDETTVCSDMEDLVTATSSLKTIGSMQCGSEMSEFQVDLDDDALPDVPICAGEVLATPAHCARDAYASTREKPIIIRSIAELDEPTIWS